MELTPSQKKTVRHQFDSFCKKVLREETRDYFKQLARRFEQEASLSELSEEQWERLYVLDEYPSDATLFDVQGYDIAISNEKLADARICTLKKNARFVPHRADRYIRVKVSHTADPPRSSMKGASKILPQSRLAICGP